MLRSKTRDMLKEKVLTYQTFITNSNNKGNLLLYYWANYFKLHTAALECLVFISAMQKKKPTHMVCVKEKV